MRRQVFIRKIASLVFALSSSFDIIRAMILPDQWTVLAHLKNRILVVVHFALDYRFAGSIIVLNQKTLSLIVLEAKLVEMPCRNGLKFHLALS